MSAPESVTITWNDDLAGAVMTGWRGVVFVLRTATRETGLDSPAIIADQIEAQLPKPKPEEPKGLGAVVLDRDGNRWVRVDPNPGDNLLGAWESEFSPTNKTYSAIDVVEVLFEGVTA